MIQKDICANLNRQCSLLKRTFQVKEQISEAVVRGLKLEGALRNF